MMPIPRRLLTQEATVRIPKEGGYGGEYQEPTRISCVRFEPCLSVSASAYQLQAPAKGTLFIDATNSEPAMEVPAGSLVSVDGEVSEACVKECCPIREAGRVHHWELVLS